MKKIALVVGHRPSAPGAYGDMGIPEFKFWNELAPILKNRMEATGRVQCRIFHRPEIPGGYGAKMKALHKEIDEWGADISISLHFNAASSPMANGHEVLYCAFSNGGMLYAKIMEDIFTKRLPNKPRGTKPKTKKERGGGFLCRGKSKCILVEPFFASNQHDYVEGGAHREDLISCFEDFAQLC